MLIKTLPVGQLETNCYVVSNEETLGCVVIDPGDESNRILDYLEDNHLKCEAIFLTHGHYDHTGAVEAVMEETGAPVYICPRDDAPARGWALLRRRRRAALCGAEFSDPCGARSHGRRRCHCV